MNRRTRLTLHYRGPLSSCNYGCDYCPFAKEWEEPDVLDADRRGLDHFVGWAAARDPAVDPPLHVLFTPWGEALVRKWYRDGIVALSHLPGVGQVAAQTNLSMNLDWLADADLRRISLWTTWHPTQVPLDKFVAQCARLDTLGVAYSVGVVGLREQLDAMDALRSAIRPDRYVWVNAYQRVDGYYTEAERARIRRIDPLFDDNRAHPSLGKACRAGETHLTVDGDGDLRRCHFVDQGEVLGNLYAGDLDRVLRPRACPNATCKCHIGYVHLEELGLYERYGDGLMARIPIGLADSATSVTQRIGAHPPR